MIGLVGQDHRNLHYTRIPAAICVRNICLNCKPFLFLNVKVKGLSKSVIDVAFKHITKPTKTGGKKP